ncbi:PLDc N-terminal domain-containing protein [uncultured Roseobacter sp.]|uniref:PLDc N-terminal domain-containing protein n=1 Tax=uncultured Roseobacter sp. TaxID=114847 RepID=UPI00261D49BB|nr:PLDc N-terminal domain-containing protein [uncultured Roseobacter sp.]
MEYGIVGLIVLIANIYALVKTWTSAVSLGAKLLWTLLILVLPVIGFIIWFFAGPRGGSRVTV